MGRRHGWRSEAGGLDRSLAPQLTGPGGREGLGKDPEPEEEERQVWRSNREYIARNALLAWTHEQRYSVKGSPCWQRPEPNRFLPGNQSPRWAPSPLLCRSFTAWPFCAGLPQGRLLCLAIWALRVGHTHTRARARTALRPIPGDVCGPCRKTSHLQAPRPASPRAAPLT